MFLVNNSEEFDSLTVFKKQNLFYGFFLKFDKVVKHKGDIKK